MDEKRLQNFKSYVLKKEDYELSRAQKGVLEKAKRTKREQQYDQVRAQFKRAPHQEVPGADKYEARLAEMEKRYDSIRKEYAAKQKRLAEALHDKIDRTKMVEYDIKSNREAKEE